MTTEIKSSFYRLNNSLLKCIVRFLVGNIDLDLKRLGEYKIADHKYEREMYKNNTKEFFGSNFAYTIKYNNLWKNEYYPLMFKLLRRDDSLIMMGEIIFRIYEIETETKNVTIITDYVKQKMTDPAMNDYFNSMDQFSKKYVYVDQKLVKAEYINYWVKFFRAIGDMYDKTTKSDVINIMCLNDLNSIRNKLSERSKLNLEANKGYYIFGNIFTQKEKLIWNRKLKSIDKSNAKYVNDIFNRRKLLSSMVTKIHLSNIVNIKLINCNLCILLNDITSHKLYYTYLWLISIYTYYNKDNNTYDTLKKSIDYLNDIARNKDAQVKNKIGGCVLKGTTENDRFTNALFAIETCRNPNLIIENLTPITTNFNPSHKFEINV